MAELVESIPGRPWLDWDGTETFDAYVARIGQLCTKCGTSLAVLEDPVLHEDTCTGPDEALPLWVCI